MTTENPKIFVRPKKELGQHFLINTGVSKRMADEVDLPETIVLEIGSGTGALTKQILANPKVKHVLAIEKDPSLAESLPQRLGSGWEGRLTVLNRDAMKVDVAQFVSQCGFEKEAQNQQIVLLANLPYNVGTEIMCQLAMGAPIFAKMVVMLQEEVVARMVAQHKTKDYSRLSILIQAIFDAKRVVSVSPNSFNPPPKVWSAVVKLEPKRPRMPDHVLQILLTLARAGFANRRKMLLKNLSMAREDKILMVAKSRLDPKVRMEDVPLEELISLAQEVAALDDR